VERVEWSPREVANAVEMARQGLTRREIARELGRTLDSVRAKLGRVTVGTVKVG
jgi:DNA-binding CsgD family transcriptional regulator